MSKVGDEARRRFKESQERERAKIREMQWCRCPRPVWGRSYRGQRIDVTCGKLSRPPYG